MRRRFAVFPCGVALRGADLTAELLRHELAAIADAEDGNAQRKDCRIHVRCAFIIDAVRPTGEDNTGRVERADFLHSGRIGLQLAVDVLLSHAAGNELVVLSAEVQNQDFLLHRFSSKAKRERLKGYRKPFETPLSQQKRV